MDPAGFGVRVDAVGLRRGFGEGGVERNTPGWTFEGVALVDTSERLIRADSAGLSERSC